MGDLVQDSVNSVVGSNLRNGLKAKDISDWIKIALLLGAGFMAYQSLKDKVAGHTQQIGDVQHEIGEMRKENRARNINTQQQLGSINMYLCSKDSTHCSVTMQPTTPDQ